MTHTDADTRAAIIAGCLVALISFGFAATFGIFLRPMSADLGWGREVFSLSIAVQTLCWGITQPFAGAIADKRGTVRVLAFGALTSAAGFALRGIVTDPTLFVLTGVIVGIGTGACSFPIVIIALGKVTRPQRRSFVLGLGTAAASTGMFAAAPLATAMIAAFGWQTSIFMIAASFLLILPALPFVARVDRPTADGQSFEAFGRAIRIAFSERSYLCLFLGFFVCGFHVAFIQTHLPAYVTDLGMPLWVGGWSLALIGLFNIAGSFLAGWSGQALSKKRVLAGIYFARAIVIAIFLLIPITPVSVCVFSAAMGLLWLATVPLTTGLIAHTQGLTYLSTLAGLIFLSHQVGGFIGAWLGGRIYDMSHDYTPVWWTAVALGLASALIHLPIREKPGPLARLEV